MTNSSSPPSDSSQGAHITRVIFEIDRQSGKVVSVVSTAATDEELNQVDRWIEAVLILSDLIRPFRIEERAAA